METPCQEDWQEEGGGGGIILGLVIGVSLVVVCIVILFLWKFYKKQKEKRKPEAEEPKELTSNETLIKEEVTSENERSARGQVPNKYIGHTGGKVRPGLVGERLNKLEKMT